MPAVGPKLRPTYSYMTPSCVKRRANIAAMAPKPNTPIMTITRYSALALPPFAAMTPPSSAAEVIGPAANDCARRLSVPSPPLGADGGDVANAFVGVSLCGRAIFILRFYLSVHL